MQKLSTPTHISFLTYVSFSSYKHEPMSFVLPYLAKLGNYVFDCREGQCQVNLYSTCGEEAAVLHIHWACVTGQTHEHIFQCLLL